MLNNSPALQNLLKRHGISFDVGKRLAKKIVSKYTPIDRDWETNTMSF